MFSSRKKTSVIFALIVMLALLLGSSGMATASTPKAISASPALAPIVNPDQTVTFTLKAPLANEVVLNWQHMVGPSPRADPYPMTKDADGVWSITMGPLEPNWYGYGFILDGVKIADPANRDIWSGDPSAISDSTAWSYVFVPGPAADFMADQMVPHGAVATVRYFSNIEQTQRQMQVYTPPGYNKNNRRYPVLYIMHGTGGNDTDWIVNMRANFILDNLIAQGAIEPMILVSPDGNVAGDHYLRDFPEELMGSIIPAIEENYRVAPGRQNRALAGLSRGGRWTMATLVKYPGYFAYIGVFSSAYDVRTEPDVYTVDLLANPDINKWTKLLWISYGPLENDRPDFRALLDEYGVNYTYVPASETGAIGGHVWDTWRHHLLGFAPLLFK